MSQALSSDLAGIDGLIAQLGWDPAAGLQLVDAAGLAARHHPNIDPARPALVRGIGAADQLARIAACLANQYPDAHPLVLLRPATDPGRDRPIAATLASLPAARGQIQEPGWLLAVPPLPHPGSMLDLAEVIAHLRAPDGCPWDRAQTHRSLRPYLLEEAYEAVEAIDAGDMEVFVEELGDVLLQVVLHAQVAVDEGSFRLPDVIRAITEKLIRRHPHVFGEVEAETPEAVVTNWERLKREERKQKGESESPFTGIPVAQPALARADAALKKAARQAAMADLLTSSPRKAMDEALDAAAASPAAGADEARDRAFGRALLALVQLARELDVDAETVLRERVTRFIAEAEARL